MSRVNEIKEKKVDFYVYPNAANVLSSVVDDEDHGKLNIVVDENSNENSLYIGDTHIASGWGFNNLSTVKELEEFISSENVKKLVSNDFTINQYITYEASAQPTVTPSANIQNTSTYFHNEEIVVKDGSLSGKTNLRISDASIIFTTGQNIKMGDVVELVFDESTLTIRNLQLKYDMLDFNVSEGSAPVNYSIYQNETKIGASSTFNATLSGKTETVNLTLTDEASKINKIYTGKENKIDYYIEVNNIKTKLFSVIYRYKIYISSTEPTQGVEPSINNVYYEAKDNELSINYTDNNGRFTYVILPGLLFSMSDISVILKKSSIAAPFTFYRTMTISGITYNIYKSRQKYNHGRTWIIK